MHLVRPLDAQEHSEDSDQNLLEHILENEGGKVGHKEEEAQGEVQASKVALVVVETPLEGVQHDAYANLGVPPGKGWGLEYRTLNPPHWIVQKQYGRDGNKRYQDDAGRNNVWQDVGEVREPVLAGKVRPVSHRLHSNVPKGDGCEDVRGDEAEASVGEEDEGREGVDQGGGHPPTSHPPIPTGHTAAAPEETFAPEEHHDTDNREEGEHGLQVLQGYDVEAVQVLTYAEGGEEAGDELQVEDAVQGAVGPLVVVDGLVQLVEGGGYQLGVEDEGVEGTSGEAHVENYDEHEEGKHGDVDGQQVVQPAPGVVLAPDAHHRIGVDGRCPSLQTLAAYVAPPTLGVTQDLSWVRGNVLRDTDVGG